jgi:tetratricopeptide (TPR) repeat protein
MAKTTTLNAKNLEALGPERLAALLIEISTGDAVAKRRLRMELAGAQSPAELGKGVRKRLAAIGRARSFVDWRGIKPLAADLEAQRTAIAGAIAQRDPAEALDLLWRFMELANPVFSRCDDSNGHISLIFRQACQDLGAIAVLAKPSAQALAEQSFRALLANEYGQFDGLITALAKALGKVGLDHLKQLMIDLSNRPVEKPAAKDRIRIGFGASGPIYQDEIAGRSRVSTVKLALREIADAQGDVDAFIAQYDAKTRKVPAIVAEIAQRLLAAGRLEEAWSAIEAAVPRPRAREDWLDFEWEDARIAVLDAMGRSTEAQEARWRCFERALSPLHLREYLKRLPDFDDVEAEEKALDLVKQDKNFSGAFGFLILWPDLNRAAALVLERTRELDGDRYEILTPASEALAGKHKLAAVLVLRAMIDFALTKNRSSRYKHAARHLLSCASLSAGVETFGGLEPHDAYVARLRREHGRKSSFWSLVE